MKTRKSFLLCGLFLLMCVSLTGCVPGDGANSAGHLAGFFSGVWHGWIAPFALIYSIFNKDIGIYEVYNNGLLYNIGYYIAIISGFGGISLYRRKKETNG